MPPRPDGGPNEEQPQPPDAAAPVEAQPKARSGRPRNPLTGDGHVVEIARALREVVDRTGMKDSEVAEKAFLSKANVSKALKGQRLPTWETTRDILRACGGEDEQQWYNRWQAARDSQKEEHVEVASAQDEVLPGTDDARLPDHSAEKRTGTLLPELPDRAPSYAPLIIAITLVILLAGAAVAGLAAHDHWRHRPNGNYLATGTQTSCNGFNDCDTSRETTLFLDISGCPESCVVTGVPILQSTALATSGQEKQATGVIDKAYGYQCQGQDETTSFTLRLTVPEFQPKELWNGTSISGTFEKSVTGDGNCTPGSISWAIVARPA